MITDSCDQFDFVGKLDDVLGVDGVYDLRVLPLEVLRVLETGAEICVLLFLERVGLRILCGIENAAGDLLECERIAQTIAGSA